MIFTFVAAFAGVVCRRGYSPLLLFYCPWSTSQWMEGGKPTPLTLFLQQVLWSYKVKALKLNGSLGMQLDYVAVMMFSQ